MNNYKLGLCSISFRENSPEDIIKAVAKSGLECIEWGSDVHVPPGDTNTVQKVVLLQDKYGVSCSSYGTYFVLGKDNNKKLYDYISTAKMLGTDIIRLWCGDKNSDFYSDEEKKHLFDICREATRIAEKENVYFCMEFHDDSFTDTDESALEIMREIHSPHFKMYWQTNIDGDTEKGMKSAEKISPYTENIHVFYWVDRKQCSLSNGKETWKKYLSRFPEDKTLLIEYIPDGKLSSLEKEAEYLREIVD